ncbi:MAG: PTS sugar transporter subunit IIA [Brevinema sp.]
MGKLLNVLEELDSIRIVDEVISWEEAVRICFKPLVEKNIVTSEYIEVTIATGKKLDFYYLITDGLAMPHGRPEDGVIKTGLSLLIIRQGVKFGNHIYNPIYCVLGLATVDNNSHIDLIIEITDIFGDENTVHTLSKFQTKNEIIKFLSK